MVLSKKELQEVNGGIGAWALLGIASVVVFLVGVIDGFVRPLKCNE